jgi:uncharacterized protein (TIGR03437 family)
MSSLARWWILAVPLAALAQTPRINAVVNAASYADGGVSPGMMVTIFGAGIGPPQIRHLAVGADGRLVTELLGTRVLFDGVPAPLIYVSATQSAAVVPYEVVARALVNVQVEYQGVRSASIVKSVVPVSPGIFAADATGRGQGAMVSPNGRPNTLANPVRPGQNVEVYFTGEGLLRDLAATGAIAAGANVTRNTFTAEVGGLPATVTYAGAAPGNVFGFAQANVTIPMNLPNGGNLPLVLRSGGVSTQANITVSVEIPPPAAVTSVFLIHGINQSASDMNAFRNTLLGPGGLNPAFYSVDATFDFADCTQNAACGASCTLANGAQRLAQHIINRNPPGDVVLVGYSLGGLLARDLIANNWSNILGRYRIRLVTLAAPLLGYPYTSFDSLVSCGRLLNEMDGNWRVTMPPVPQLSGYLNDIMVKWRNGSFPGAGAWLAASGRFCATGVRGQTGCRDANLRNDGVVCDDSAAYNIETPAGTAPSRRWQDPSALYAHTSNPFAALIFGCAAQLGVNLTLSDPPPGPLLNEILAAIRGTAPQAAPAPIDMSGILSMSPAEQAAYVRAAIAQDFPADRAEGLAVLLRNLPAVAVATLEEFIAGADDRGSVLVAKAAEWIAFAAEDTAAAAIGRLTALDPRFAGLAAHAREHARHVRKIQ